MAAGRRGWEFVCGGGREERRRRPALVWTLLVMQCLGAVVAPVGADTTDGNSEYLKREHSLIKPYQGVGSSSMPMWDFSGSTMLTGQYIRLTPDDRSKSGSIWNRMNENNKTRCFPTYLQNTPGNDMNPEVTKR